MKYKVAQIIPYFGKWPEWIELYFYSCGRNPMVDFIFYTDCPLPKHRYENTVFHQCTFEEYKSLVSSKLGIDFTNAKPYKLCDLRPFFPRIHEDVLKEYDFWGYGDLDLIFGDLSMIVNDNMLSKYDVITTHSYRVAGHFTVVRNNDYYRNLGFKIKDWQHGLVDVEHQCYDECAWTNLVNPANHNIDRLYRHFLKYLGVRSNKVHDFLNNLLLRRKYIQELHTTPWPQPEFNNNKQLRWEYDVENSKITSPTGIVIPYLHFMAFKKCQYIKTEDYWKDGFWQIDDEFEKYRIITFDYKKVIGVSEVN